MHPSDDPASNLQDLFTYQASTEKQQSKYKAVFQKGFEFANLIMESTPSCVDQSEAIRKIREAVMFANAAVALEDDIGVH